MCANTLVNQKIRILSVTLAVEEATFLGSLKKGQYHHTQQLVPVVNSGDTRHTGNRHRDVLIFLPTSFLMHPGIGPLVTMPTVLLGAKTMTHAGASRLFPPPGPGVYDPGMPECLVSVAQLLWQVTV